MAQQPDQQSDGRNRRQYERLKTTRRVKLEATLRGRFIDIMRLEMTGVTIDVSNGGFCANVDQSISPGVRCRVELQDDEGNEHNLWGRVRRTTGGKNGYVVALEFDEPVEAAAILGSGSKSAVIAVTEEDESAGAAPKAEGKAEAK